MNNCEHKGEWKYQSDDLFGCTDCNGIYHASLVDAIKSGKRLRKTTYSDKGTSNAPTCFGCLTGQCGSDKSDWELAQSLQDTCVGWCNSKNKPTLACCWNNSSMGNDHNHFVPLCDDCSSKMFKEVSHRQHWINIPIMKNYQHNAIS